MNNPLVYTDPSGYNAALPNRDRPPAMDFSKNFGGDYSTADPWYEPYHYGGGGGSGTYGGPGYGLNGTGLNGVYYDWYSGSYKSTSEGNPSVSWDYVYNEVIAPVATQASFHYNGKYLTYSYALPPKHLMISNKALITNGNNVYLTYNRTNGLFYLPGTNIQATSSVLFADYTTRLGMVQTGGDGGVLADWWYNSSISHAIPVSVNLNFSLSFPAIGSVNVGVSWALRGHNQGIYLTKSHDTKWASSHGGVGLNLGFSWYDGDTRNLYFDELYAFKAVGWEADLGFLGAASQVTYNDPYGGQLWTGEVGIGGFGFGFTKNTPISSADPFWINGR